MSCWICQSPFGHDMDCPAMADAIEEATKETMKYQDKKFSVPYGTSIYRENWEKVFKKPMPSLIKVPCENCGEIFDFKPGAPPPHHVCPNDVKSP